MIASPEHERPKWSNTRIALYGRCPYAYKRRYVDDEPAVATQPMLTGRDYHHALERYGTHCYRGGKRPVKTDFDEARHIAAGYPDIESDLIFALENITWDWGSMLPGDTGPVEVMYEAPLPNDEIYRGRIDLLQRYAEGASDDPFSQSEDNSLWMVTDWKSGFSQWSDEEAPLQLLSYAWLVQQAFPEALDFMLAIETLRGKSPPGWRVSGKLDWVAERLSAQIDRILADEDLQAEVGPSCIGCQMINCCKHAQSASMLAITTSPLVTSNKVICADELAKHGKAQLKAVVKEIGRGITAGNGLEWAWDEQEVIECVSPRSFAEIMEQLGVDPWQFLSVTPAKFRDALTALPEGEREMLLEVGKAKKRRSFGLQKLAGEVEPSDDADAATPEN